jgi:HAD superfamily hydrolase (TIGR01484 family)
MAKKLIVFDLDGTLAISKTAIDGEMARLLGALLAVVQVAVISGGDWPQFASQLLVGLGDVAHLRNLSLLPTCGTKFYRYERTWLRLYAEDFTAAEKATIRAALAQALTASAYAAGTVWGETIEDRGSQITFSALGQRAPIAEKTQWDPDFAKRKIIKAHLDALLPAFSVRLGGTTSIDITKPGIDKGYGISKLRDVLGVALEDMIFIGDALFPGGNDYPAKEVGVVSIRVKDPYDTQRLIEAIVACLGGDPPTRSFATDAAR